MQVTDDLENLGQCFKNVDQGQNLKKIVIFDTRIILKKLSTSNLADGNGNKKLQMRSEFGIITADKYHLCFHKFYSVFHLFQVEEKQKVLRISETT